jgi:signal transduction histidine kinase
MLGGEHLVVFGRDDDVGALLPAPGFAQTLRGARAWRALVDACLGDTEVHHGTLQPPGTRDPREVPAYAFACADDAVAVVVGAASAPESFHDLQALLPLLAATFRGERAVANARSQAALARQAAAHAEALAASLDRVRALFQEALADADAARRELEAANEQLQEQAAEQEAQSLELELAAEELRGANVELDAARAAAESASRAKSEFLATMSHELRTPLNAIGGHVQLIQLGIYGPVTEAQHTALERIDRSQRHLLGLINNILNLSRIESGHVEYDIAPLDLDQAVADLHPMIAPQLEARTLRYSVQLPAPAPRVLADREKLQQILLNLLSNAVKFTDPGGSVELSAAAAGDVVTVTVRDSGIGIPAEKLQSVFEPFVQVDGSHSRAGQGTGLGLAISRDLARGMRGDLRAESVLGGGSTFVLTLPAAARAMRS